MKLVIPLLLILTLSFVPVFADTSGDLSVVSGNAYQIHYEAKYSQVHSVQVNKGSQSIIFSVSATSSIASLQLTLPRELIDAKQSDGTDDKFIVLVDETFASETEKDQSSLTRTILISLTPDSKEVEIIGTHLGGIAISTQKNNTLTTPPPSPIITPEKPVEQKPVEKNTSQQSPSQSTISQLKQNPSQTESAQEQILQQITSLLHFKSGYLPLDMGKKQIVEYSIIAAITLVIIIAIASSVRSKHKKSIRK